MGLFFFSDINISCSNSSVSLKMYFQITFNWWYFPVQLYKCEQKATKLFHVLCVYVSRGRNRRVKVYLAKKVLFSLLLGRATIARSSWHPSLPRILSTGQCQLRQVLPPALNGKSKTTDLDIYLYCPAEGSSAAC